MICVLPFCQKDVGQAIDLLRWIRLLGDCKNHTCLLVADADVQWWKANQVINLAQGVFSDAVLITTDDTSTDWCKGANELFLRAALYVEEVMKEPWLWLEPDAIPLKAGWLDALASVYATANRPFMGFIYEFNHPEPPIAPFKLMSGVSVYPADAWSRMAKGIKFAPNLAFDVACAATTTGEGVHTNLIQHFYGEVGLPPTFVETQTPESRRNAFGFDRIHKNAVIFHRCKDGSLTKLLHDRLLSKRFVVVFPFCNRDGGLLAKNLQWMDRMGGCQSDTCLLAYDGTCRNDLVKSVEGWAIKNFRHVINFLHKPPVNTNHPYAANHVFRTVAEYMQGHVRRPWLWFEPDMVPLKRGWLDTLQEQYTKCGKSFFGAVVPGMDHFNGTAIYPADTLARCPNAMNDSGAFDMLIRHDIGGQYFDASQSIQCGWVMDRGMVKPHGSGDAIHFRTIADVKRNILGTALLFHRDKSLSLIDRFIEMGVA